MAAAAAVTVTRALPKPVAVFKGKNASAIPVQNPGYLFKPGQRSRRKEAEPAVVKHGEHIFVYNNLQTNQVIYSLTRSLRVRLLCLSQPTKPCF